ncbi:NADH:ubiquinone oxidoreductase chain I-like protein [Desulfosporosinus acidiphilus SJ4]|uniref:NADH:ubiquinone oxidoreductase chain I-like protein n=1 Tax=Desulfosporosinus acidiphilus (strain DSM 22704 / JCM 16185 / SJ4) TaxID=646529 RepID=I4D2S5_DESAJ|nr:4Fe-4S binding protein [Desulfosporosinus acidiphilus]AFM40099.1 NADH:ubiquinone oxidoreductase chain I-like protein [Desulfosporosinus acidiphilus SJ4]
MIAQITIDYALCQDPLNCRKCLSICPSVVFVCGPTKVWKGRESDSREYKIIGRYYDKCSGCGDCEEVCPTNALKVTFIPREQLAQKFREERAAQLKERQL